MESAFGRRRPPSDWGGRYAMPTRGNSTRSDSSLNCGCRRERGNARTSAIALTPCAATIATSSSNDRVEWPTVKIRGVEDIGQIHCMTTTLAFRERKQNPADGETAG